MVLLELLSRQDGGFVDALRQTKNAATLKSVVDQWRRDSRPWARQQVLDYLAQPLDCPGHQVVVKRLFKQVEEKRDVELMGAFACAFDGLVRRRLRWGMLKTPANGMPGINLPRQFLNPKTLQPLPWQPSHRPGTPLFSNRTRNYLRRRAWRFFRRMAFQQPEQYVQSVCTMLSRYTDADLRDGIAMLDSWSLMHACFFKSPAIAIGRVHVNLAEDRSLSELAAAPFKQKLWTEAGAMAVLLELLIASQSRLVRQWTMQMLRGVHQAGLRRIAPELLLKMLDHADAEVQQFGAEVLQVAEGLERLPLATWLKLLEVQNLTALGNIVAAMRKHVTADRLDLSQRIELACAPATPVARLGFDFLKQRPPTGAEQRRLAELASARCAAMAGELAALAMTALNKQGSYDVELIGPFFDSRLREMRSSAWEAVVPGTPAYDDAVLWSRLLETPFEDLRLELIATMERRALPGADAKQIAGLWCAVLLGVHRGGRAKLKALRQISDALANHPQHGEALIPVLALAMRSVRPTERNHALAALVGAIEARPDLQASAARFIPELSLQEVG